MFGIPRIYGFVAGGLLALALMVGIRMHFASDERVRTERDGLRTWQSDTVEAVKEASDNPDVNKDTAGGQIRAIGDSNRSLKAQVDMQNQAIDDMAREAVRLRKRADELKAIADRAQAQRRSALRKLSDMAITPGTREDCLTLLKEANEALDLVREAGL